MKNLLLTCLLFLPSITVFCQQGPKWSTEGNSISSNDFIGTTNNFPLDFRINNITRMFLGTDGGLTLGNLAGTGSRVLMVDINGKLLSLSAGQQGQFLQGNGSWANLPGGATSWSLSGSNLVSTNNGNIGIGTNNPISKLTVIGDVSISNNLLVGGGVITTNTLNSSSKINAGDVNVASDLLVAGSSTFNGNSDFSGSIKSSALGNGNGYQQVFVGPNGVLLTKSSVGNLFPSSSCSTLNPSWQIGGNTITGTGLTDPSVGTCDDVQFGIKQNNQNRVYFSNSSNFFNIGFGTTQPSQRWHFSGGNILLDNVNAPSGQVRFSIIAGDNVGMSITTSQENTIAYRVFSTTYNATTFKVFGDGRTQIGSMTQVNPSAHTDASLTVNGKVVAKSCYITLSNWADYVFDEQYVVPNLYDIEKYYKANKHLPEIPTENEVIENGVNVAEMNKLLLKKIEELTILMVKQQREIDELKLKDK